MKINTNIEGVTAGRVYKQTVNAVSGESNRTNIVNGKQPQ